MATIQPEGEKLRQAVRWISEERKADASRATALLIEEASRQFNLSLREEEFLRSFYDEKGQ